MGARWRRGFGSGESAFDIELADPRNVMGPLCDLAPISARGSVGYLDKQDTTSVVNAHGHTVSRIACQCVGPT